MLNLAQAGIEKMFHYLISDAEVAYTIRQKLSKESNKLDEISEGTPGEENGEPLSAKSFLKPTSTYSIRKEKVMLERSPRSVDNGLKGTTEVK